MKKRKVVSLALAGMLSMGLLSGCGAQDVQAEVSKEPKVAEEIVDSEVVEEVVESDNTVTNWEAVESYVEKPESRTYGSYEHLFYKRVQNIGTSLVGANSKIITGGSIEIPEGYEVLEINNFDGLGGKIGTQQTYGFDIWFINTVPVLVEPVYNEGSRCYDYSCPGTVIELEQTSESEMKLIK